MAPAENRPREAWLVVLAMLAISPLWLRAIGSTLGSYGMFTAPVSYRVELSSESQTGELSPIALRSLEPHLGRDARRLILPAGRGFIGETQVALMAEGLDDIGRLACELEPRARSIVVKLQRTKLDRSPLAPVSSRVSCEKAR